MIRVENLSKRYRIGVKVERARTLSEVVGSFLASPFSNMRRLQGLTKFNEDDEEDVIWALKDLSFEVKQGEVVGIIGRNGAGKSTLLKILSRITPPTHGRISIHGRVSSLLEVGTGFHPELSGRENIYLNGTILGMRKAEVDRRFDEIVDFSGVEKFIDTPVKRYSSGMTVRLAFAVAAHLEPEVLLIDEVLAVGDHTFQKKCLGKMEDISGTGRTVFFVSHSMPMILRLCRRVLLLKDGQLIADGNTSKIVSKYVESGQISPRERRWDHIDEMPGDEVAKLKYVGIKRDDGRLSDSFSIDEGVHIEIQYIRRGETVLPTAIIHIVNEEGVTLFASNDFISPNWSKLPSNLVDVRSICKIPAHFLAEGRFYVLVALGSYNPNVIHAIERDIVSFQVIDETTESGVRGSYAGGNWPGVVRPKLEWNVQCLD